MHQESTPLPSAPTHNELLSRRPRHYLAVAVTDLTPLYVELKKVIEQLGWSESMMVDLMRHAYRCNCLEGCQRPDLYLPECQVAYVTVDLGPRQALVDRVVFSHTLVPDEVADVETDTAA